MSDKQIAQKLDIALSTVRTHLSRLFVKLNVRDRLELVLHLIRESRNNAKEPGN